MAYLSNSIVDTRCQLRSACEGVASATARAEISGLIQPDLAINRTSTMRHWCGDVCNECLRLLCKEQSKYPATASLRIADVTSLNWDEAMTIGNGRVFTPRVLLIQLHPAIVPANVWIRPDAPLLAGADALADDEQMQPVVDEQDQQKYSEALQPRSTVSTSAALPRLRGAGLGNGR